LTDYGKVMMRQRWPAQREDERGAQREATHQPAGHDERMRGQHNERRMRDGVTTSWHDKTMKRLVQQDEETARRAARREATQQPACAMRGQEGGVTRGQGEVILQQAGTRRGREGGARRGWQEAMQQPAGRIR
jgi:hypothetical protein